MKFVTLTVYLYDCYDKDEVKVTVNAEQIVMMKDIRDYSDFSTEIEFSNKSVLLVEESVLEILDKINGS